MSDWIFVGSLEVQVSILEVEVEIEVEVEVVGLEEEEGHSGVLSVFRTVSVTV